MKIKGYKKYKEYNIFFIKKYWYTFVIVGFISIVMFVNNINDTIKKGEEIDTEYPYLKTADTVKGIVINATKVITGNLLRVELSNGLKTNLGWASNGIYNPIEICDFVVVGDSINKKMGSDTLFIYRSGEIYHFLLAKRLNESSR
ncbi:MAG: hypothetical protein HRT73_07505 [Flavobacteriales bacterium]|nr:hypothetical protein [Flavobacteriales bacterium]